MKELQEGFPHGLLRINLRLKAVSEKKGKKGKVLKVFQVNQSRATSFKRTT